jgi:Luciferase-like monooxygenase
MQIEKTAIAMRPTVFSPGEIVKFAKTIDQSGISHVFIPDRSVGFDSIEISSASLGVSKGLRIGSGVIRPLEHDVRQLVRRLETLQALSENRFLLGIGTGDPGPNPKQKVGDMIQRLQELKDRFSSKDGIKFPEVYIAALKIGIAKRVAPFCSGVLLNFCSSGYAGSLVQGVRQSFAGPIEFACYLKVFFSRSQQVAQRLMIAEFGNYNTFPQYHKMFERDGIADEIKKAVDSLKNDSYEVPKSLLEISPVNPSQSDLSKYVSSYRKAGITMPCVYPYFSTGEKTDFKLETIRTIISAAEQSGER